MTTVEETSAGEETSARDALMKKALARDAAYLKESCEWDEAWYHEVRKSLRQHARFVVDRLVKKKLIHKSRRKEAIRFFYGWCEWSAVLENIEDRIETTCNDGFAFGDAKEKVT